LAKCEVLFNCKKKTVCRVTTLLKMVNSITTLKAKFISVVISLEMFGCRRNRTDLKMRSRGNARKSTKWTTVSSEPLHVTYGAEPSFRSHQTRAPPCYATRVLATLKTLSPDLTRRAAHLSTHTQSPGPPSTYLNTCRIFHILGGIYVWNTCNFS
jgi:hypothetical protein